MAVKAVPDGYQTVTPYICVPDLPKFLELLQKAFDAKVTFSAGGSSGKVSHAEVKLGTSMIMLGQSTDHYPPTPCALYLYVDDVDAWYKRACKAGLTSMGEPKDQYYGDRSGGVKDEFGNQWWLATHIEDVSAEELGKRAAALGK